MSSIRFLRIALTLLIGTVLTMSMGQGLAQTPDIEDTADQIALFAELRDKLTADGQEVVGLFLAGEEEMFLARSSSEIQEALSTNSIGNILETLQTNRVRMEFPEYGVHFDGRFDGSTTMSGFYQDTSAGAFELTAEDEQTGDVPIGRWNGVVYPGQFDISIVFSGSADTLSATIDIPLLNVSTVPLSNVAFSATQPIGEVVIEQALPMTPASRAYAAIHEWGSGYFAFSTEMDDAGNILEFLLRPFWAPAPDPASEYVSDVPYRIPGDGQLLVFWGGENDLATYRAAFPSQRYAYDFVVWQNGSTFAGDGTRNEDYYVWGLPVVAPAAGTVIAVENAMPDFEPGQLLSTMDPAEQEGIHPAGNHVVIQVAENEYVFLSNMQEGSVSVAVGDTVVAGAPSAWPATPGTAPNRISRFMHSRRQTSMPRMDRDSRWSSAITRPIPQQ